MNSHMMLSISQTLNLLLQHHAILFPIRRPKTAQSHQKLLHSCPGTMIITSDPSPDPSSAYTSVFYSANPSPGSRTS